VGMYGRKSPVIRAGYREGAETPVTRGKKGEVNVAEDAVEFARERLGMEMDERQAGVLRSGRKQVIMNCTRQWGKSTVTAVKALHTMMRRGRSLVIVVSPGGRQSAEFVRKTKEIARTAGIKVRGDGDNRISLALENGSRIVGLPSAEERVRGFSAAAMVIVEEAAWVKDGLYEVVRPMLAVTNGDLWLLSTAGGKRGYFYRTWTKGGDDWERVSVTGEECPRIVGEFLERERKGVREERFRAEYMCEFVDDCESVFPEKDIEGIWDTSLKELRL
jgi:hypothetical protein